MKNYNAKFKIEKAGSPAASTKEAATRGQAGRSRSEKRDFTVLRKDAAPRPKSGTPQGSATRILN
jgi:hypothetical protein